MSRSRVPVARIAQSTRVAAATCNRLLSIPTSGGYTFILLLNWMKFLAIQEPLVSASITEPMFCRTIAYTLPVLIDMWIYFNDGLTVQSYQRRLLEALAYHVPKLILQMSKDFNQTYMAFNITDLVPL
ncbi:uncharacterized protein BT62DRAFT_1009522 [Guyanagaster necrorhizus]|uniref:Uncharacterized protein n=1 Tax=Guyanagaster necrorhizus TaxID=856835 RepID=A0A9P7VLF1_9AGAR|nr:uncharacterized protein BT62DRAFT_1009522 [Guyanagaster necrorhizus MCA 3950]KAG7443311.1 hypothetical protein BT62DRAFT_1009522 [Guyanagaster necrorhizus MCA 3950]